MDGNIVGQAQYGLPRPDVLNAYPEYQNANAEYQYNLDTRKLTNGYHSLTVQETGNNGNVTVIKSVSINVGNLPAVGWMDDPATGTTVSGNSTVRGWLIDGSGVAKVEVLVDGDVVGQAQYGLSRPDVLTYYPEYQNSNGGYEFTLNTENLSNGTHYITVRSTALNGTTKHLQGVTVNVQNLINLPGIGFIDSPVAGSTVKGTTSVRGWVLDGSGVAKVEVLIDGNIVGQAQYGIARPDVLKAYPEYQNANAEYQYDLDTKKLTNGYHSLTVQATGNNGKITVLRSVSINVQNLPAVGWLDEPVTGSTVNGTATVRGWFLDGSGVSKVEVLVDGNVVGQAQYGGSRSDVLKYYQEYQNSNGGYEFSLNTVNFSNGIHNITVRSTATNGTTTQLKGVNVNIQNLINMPGIGYIDSPTASSIVNGITSVRGWFLDGSGVDKVEVLVDGSIIGQAQYGFSRPDVLKAYPEYQNANAEYQFNLDTRKLSNGDHVITVQATGKNGKLTVLRNIPVSVQNLEHLPTIRFLDSPKAGTTVNGITNVRGWYLDGSGVAKIEVLMDGKIIGLADYGIYRPDVLNAYPEYFNANAEFQFALDTFSFPDGQHTLTVRETSKNGNTNSISANITISNGNPYLALNLKKPSNITANDIINFFNSKNYANSPLKLYAQSFIDAQNRYGVNAQYLVAHAIWETGWGGSDLIGYKNNLYGYGAYDSCPFTCGYYFQSVPDSIFRVAYQVRVDYLNESGKWFEGPNLAGMNVHYATDQNWKNGIANLMRSMKSYDSSYYSNTSELGMSSIAPPPLVRDIPAGLPYPEDTIINFPSGIVANIVNTTSLNMRSLPYVTSSLISSVSQNTKVNILGYNTDVSYNPGSTGNYAFHWFRVNVNGQTGWMYGGYLSVENLLQVNHGIGSLNIRSSATTSSSVLASTVAGTYLKAVMVNGVPVTQNGWYNVYLPNSTTTGWVSGDFINRMIN
ncbi:beta-N-acetylglucosaminidase [Neobacillus niacini]|nr:beta-N-acetylglucosaminidase [Neobacillus niacini]